MRQLPLSLPLFSQCMERGVYGTYDICPNWTNTNDNGNLQAYAESHGGPGYGAFLTFNQTFGYDGVNRLISATDSGGWSRSYDHDQYGNFWVTAASGGPWSGTTPTSNIFSGTTSRMSGQSYDNAGNLLSVNGNALAYNAENLVTSVAGSAWTYRYDGLGERVGKAPSSGSATTYVYDAFGQLAAEYAGGTSWLRDYVREGGGGLVATENSAGACTTCYFAYDHLGSVRLVMDGSGNVVGRHDYLPFGEEIPANTDGRDSHFGPGNDSVTQKFTGQMRDGESGMDYFNARYFGSALGQFTSADPGQAGADPLNPQSWNGYGYVLGNPLSAMDPTGMDPIAVACPDCTVTVTATPDPVDVFDYPTYEVLTGYDPNSPLFTAVGTAKAPVVTESSSGARNWLLGYVLRNFPSMFMPGTRLCAGLGRGLKGNPSYVAKTPKGGAFARWGVHPAANTAAVIPSQFNFQTTAQMVPYIGQISGTVGTNVFTSVSDVVGGSSPLANMPVRDALQQLNPGNLIIEVPGGVDTGRNADVTVHVPASMSCPAWTAEVQ